jgi:hypothetical protein
MYTFKHLIVSVQVIMMEHSTTLCCQVVDALFSGIAVVALALVLPEKDVSVLQITIEAFRL